MIIQKQADQLQPGDILPATIHRPRRVVLYSIPGPTPDSALVLGTAPFGISQPMAPPVPESYAPDADIVIEVLNLTPAQEHAAELLDLVREVATCTDESQAADWARRAMVLVEAIDPPKPPTLAEALAALVNLEPKLHALQISREDRRIAPVLGLLERARRCGLLPSA